MKLLNYTVFALSASLALILSVWAVVFYFNTMDEVHDSIDDGLANYKLLIIRKAQVDSLTLAKSAFDEGNYAIREVPEAEALSKPETYETTEMYMEYEEDMEPVRLLTTYFSTPDGRYYELRIIASMVEEDDLLEDLLTSLFWLYAVVISCTFLINNLLLKRIWRPFYQLRDRLKAYRIDSDQDFVPPATRISEFRQLNDTVSDLLRANRAAYQQQKQFIENASHELQTPLAISINKLEMLTEQCEPDTVPIVMDVLGQLKRLTRLNKSLLLLSKIENRQFPTVTTVDFNSLIRQQLKDFEELFSFKELDIAFEEEGELRMTMNQDLANFLLANLFKNAMVHNEQNGKIFIRVSATGFSIANTGQDTALDGQRIFQRLYKTESKKGSHGLGLTIARSIAELYNATLDYSFRENRHNFIFKKH